MNTHEVLSHFFHIIVGLGFMIIAMSLLSESLQSIFEKPISFILNQMNSSRVLSTVAGMSVSTLIQSSGTTSNMAMSCARTHFWSFEQVLFVMLGAGLGTAFTPFIFFFSIPYFDLFLMGFGSLSHASCSKKFFKKPWKRFVFIGLFIFWF